MRTLRCGTAALVQSRHALGVRVAADCRPRFGAVRTSSAGAWDRRGRRFRPVSIFVLLTVVFALSSAVEPLAAQTAELEQLLDALRDKALSVHIIARVTERGASSDTDTVWNMELREVTISGRSVSVRLEGVNIVVAAEFTPYQDEANGSLLLVAQGQTWVSTDSPDEVRYRTAFRSMPLEMGESVLFFPLGLNVETEQHNAMNIELEIRVVPFEADQPESITGG